MKKTLSIVLVSLIFISTFSILSLRVETEEIIWNIDPIPLANPTASHSSIIHDNKVYLIGGQTTDRVYLPNVYFAFINPDGTVGSWHETTPLPNWRFARTATVVWNNFVYVIGGVGPEGAIAGGTEQRTVYRGEILNDGTIEEWIEMPQLPDKLQYHTATIWNDRIYVIGGWNGYYRKNTIYIAEINPTDGSLGGWTQNPTSLPRGYEQMGVVVHQGTKRIYLMGGWRPPLDVVYSAPINEADGTIGPFRTEPTLPMALACVQAVLIGDDIYVVGGRTGLEYNEKAEKTVYKVTIQEDGTLGEWTELQSIPEERQEHSLIIFQDQIYVIGGGITQDSMLIPKDTIYYSSFSRPPYRRMITIDNTGNPNTLTDFQVFINVTYDPNMQADFDDLRFTWYNETSGEEVDIDYWLDKYVTSEYALVWVEVPEIRGSGEEILYMYYGYPYAVSGSNGEETFVFFDGFSTDTTANYHLWSPMYPTGNPNEFSWDPNGWLFVNASIRERYGRNSNVHVYHKTAVMDPSEDQYWLETRCKAFGDGWLDYLGVCNLFKRDSMPQNMYFRMARVAQGIRDEYPMNRCSISGGWGSWEFSERCDLPMPVIDPWFRIGLGTASDGTVVGSFHDDDYSELCTLVGHTTHQDIKWWVDLIISRILTDDWATMHAYFDYVRVRKFADPEPLCIMSGELFVTVKNYDDDVHSALIYIDGEEWGSLDNIPHFATYSTQNIEVTGDRDHEVEIFWSEQDEGIFPVQHSKKLIKFVGGGEVVEFSFELDPILVASVTLNIPGFPLPDLWEALGLTTKTVYADFYKVTSDGHFEIYYDPSSPYISQSYLDYVDQAAVKSWERLVPYLGSPYDEDGDGRIEILITNLNFLAEGSYSGVLGYCWKPPHDPNGLGMIYIDDNIHMWTGYWDFIKAVIPHEFTHMIEYNYDPTEDTWIMEGMAQFGADYTLDIPGLLQYYVDKFGVNPDVDLEHSSVGHYCAGYVFFEFLAESFGQSIIRTVLDRTVDYDGRVAVEQATGQSFSELFNEFAVWNYVNEYSGTNDGGTTFEGTDIHAKPFETHYLPGHVHGSGSFDDRTFTTDYINFTNLVKNFVEISFVGDPDRAFEVKVILVVDDFLSYEVRDMVLADNEGYMLIEDATSYSQFALAVIRHFDDYSDAAYSYDVKSFNKKLKIKADSPVNIMATAPDDLRVGYDPFTHTVVDEIEGASYSGPGTEPQVIEILEPLDGNYEILVTGTARGTYTLTMEMMTPEAFTTRTHTGETVEDAVYAYTVSITDEVMTTTPNPVAELEHLKEFISELPDECFDQSTKAAYNLKKALFNKIDEVILKVEVGNYTDAMNKLFHDIRAKMDGDSTAEDWIVCQTIELCIIIDHIISSIETLQQE